VRSRATDGFQYVFAWKLDQAANIHLETRATGILSTHLIMPGETSPYGNIVNPGVLAPNHQHLFSIRIDPAIGALGEGNTVIQEDSVPMPFDRADPPANNPWGVGYTVEKTVIEKSGWADAAPFKNRVFKVGRMDLTPCYRADKDRLSTPRGSTQSLSDQSATSWCHNPPSLCSVTQTVLVTLELNCEFVTLVTGISADSAQWRTSHLGHQTP
jgi:primary-amine oxidase